MKDTSLKIFVIQNRDPEIPIKSPNFLKIVKGGYQPSKGDYIQDNLGENISDRDLTWAEITAFYYVWKNYKNLEFVGFCHFRRYFYALSEYPYFGQDFFNLTPTAENMEILTSEVNVNALKRILTVTDCIVARPRRFAVSVKDQFCSVHPDWDIFIEGIRHLGSPYADYCAWFDHTNSINCCNMFIMRWTDFDKYMSVLFRLLDWVGARRIYSDKQIAYQAERFLSFYLHVNRLSKVEIPYAMLEAGMVS